MSNIPDLPRPVYPAFPPPQHRRSSLPITLAILAALMALSGVPYFVQQVEYAITRGREEAQADVARQQLHGAPDTANMYRQVAKVVAPTVVGIEALQGNNEEEADE